MYGKPHIKLARSVWTGLMRWCYEPRHARENLCNWAHNWCAARNSSEGRK